MLSRAREASKQFKVRVAVYPMVLMFASITPHSGDDTPKSPSLCGQLENNTVEIEALVKRVGEFYRTEQRKRWRHIVETFIDPNDFGSDPNAMDERVRTWKETEKYIDTVEYKIFEVQQCGAICRVTTRVWWRDRAPGLMESDSHGISDEHTWWTWRSGKWSNTTEYERWIGSFGKTLHSDPNDPTPVFWIESPREEFLRIWSQPIE